MNKRKLLIVSGLSFFLIACGVAPKQQVKQPDIITPEVLDLRTQEQKLFDDIALKYSQTRDLDTRNLSLLKLADYYQQIDRCPASDIIIAAIQETINTTFQNAFANVLKAECALKTLETSYGVADKQPTLTVIEKWINNARPFSNSRSVTIGYDNPAIDLPTRLHVASALLYAQRQQYQNALTALFKVNIPNTFADNPKRVSQLYDYAWQWYSQTDEDTRTSFANSYQILAQFKIILDTIQNSSLDDSQRQASIRNWLSTNPNELLTQHVPHQLQRYLAISMRPNNQSIAVLLPLSGRLYAQGEAIKQGILSAYYGKLARVQENDEPISTRIEFIDTGSQNEMSTTVNNESLADFDIIVGPLLRSHVDQMKTLDLSQKHQLVLNDIQFPLSQNEPSPVIQVSFSLAPEQEAQQLVALMRQRNITNPVIIEDGSSTAKRIKTAFDAAWNTSHIDQPGQVKTLQHIQYNDNKSMRVGITSALDVLQSEKRINQLSNLHPETVHSVTRNRRDIDAFVIFARPNDVALINPIIESSLSLFTNDHIPVFATSNGYDHKQGKNSQRDLRNLVFVDMPWLLPQIPENSLRLIVDQLFNEPPSSFLRLFAFGHDAYALIDNLAQLTTFRHLSLTGLSGTLSVNHEQQLMRKLSALSISNPQS